MSASPTQPFNNEEETPSRKAAVYKLSPPTTRNRKRLSAENTPTKSSPTDSKLMQRFDKCKIFGKDNKVFYIKLNRSKVGDITDVIDVDQNQADDDDDDDEESLASSPSTSFTVTSDSRTGRFPIEAIKQRQNAAQRNKPNEQVRRSLRSLKKESIVIKKGQSLVQLSPEMKKKCEELISSNSMLHNMSNRSADSNQSFGGTRKENTLRDILTSTSTPLVSKTSTPKVVTSTISKMKSPLKSPQGINSRFRITPKRTTRTVPAFDSVIETKKPATSTPKQPTKIIKFTTNRVDSQISVTQPASPSTAIPSTSKAVAELTSLDSSKQLPRTTTEKVHSSLITSPSKTIEPFHDAAEMNKMLDNVGADHDIDELIQTFYLPKTTESNFINNNPSICKINEDEADLEPRQKIIAEKCALVKANNKAQLQRSNQLKKSLSKCIAFLMSQHASNEIASVINKAITSCRKRDLSRQPLLPQEKMLPSREAYVRRIEEVARRQQETRVYKPRNTDAATGLGSTIENLKKGDPVFANRKKRILTKLSPTDAAKIRETSGLLERAMKQVRNAVDSDATDSSTDESADEADYNNTRQQKMQLNRRAAWRWAHDRAAIGNRWQYLQLQIVDLDHRIRYNDNKLNELRSSKGVITLEGSANTMDDGENVQDFNNCARTRPLQVATFKKRKLVQTSGLHMISAKVARPTSTKCGCKWPLQPCILCTGRVNPMEPSNPRFSLSHLEQIAQLDKCFHPVLSLPNDIPLTLYLEKRFGDPEWQAKADKIPLDGSHDPAAKAMARNSSKQPKGGTPLAKNDKSQQNSKGRRDNQNKGIKKPKGRRPLNLKHSKSQDLGQSSWHDGLTPSPNGLPRLGNASPPTKEGRRISSLYDKRARQSFDIDNIVIPYSAGTQRVEMLKCKEIATPSWRLVSKKKGKRPKLKIPIAEQVEDISDEAITIRHEVRLLEEREKFRANLKLPWGMRPRSKPKPRSDRVGSSGPASPAINTPPNDTAMDGATSPALNGGGDSAKGDTTPVLQLDAPPTPTNSEDLPLANDADTFVAPNTSLQALEELELQRIKRRRTVSSRLDRDLLSLSLEARLNSLTECYVVPYEPLKFPLSDAELEEMTKLMPPPESEEEPDDGASDDVKKETVEIETELPAITNENDVGMEVDLVEDVDNKEDDVVAMNVVASGSGGVPRVGISSGASRVGTSGVKAVMLNESDSDFEAPNEDPKDPEWNGSE